nr:MULTISPECIES: CsgG/HfaB family protein [Myxococcaceae]
MRAGTGLLCCLLWASSAGAQQPPLPLPPPPAGTQPRASAEAKPRLLVTDLSAQGVSAQEAAALTDAVVQSLTERNLFEVLSRRDVETLLTAERQRQLLGTCDARAEACAQDVGGALGARYVLSGSLSKLGPTYELSLQVLDTVKGRPVGRSTRLARELSTLRQLVPYTVAEASGAPLPPPASRVLPYSLLGAGSAALLGGGVYGLIALSRQKVLNDELCPEGPVNGTCQGRNLRELDYYRQENSRLGRDKTLALVAMGAGAGLLAAGFLLMPPPEGGPRIALVPTGRGFALAGVLP